MAVTEFNNTTITCRIEADSPVPVGDGHGRALLDALYSLHASVPLEKFDVERTSTSPLSYTYKFVAVDGRKWEQAVEFASQSDDDPAMDFMADPWKMSEFALHRPVRDRIVALVNKFGLSKVKCRWPA